MHEGALRFYEEKGWLQLSLRDSDRALNSWITGAVGRAKVNCVLRDS